MKDFSPYTIFNFSNLLLIKFLTFKFSSFQVFNFSNIQVLRICFCLDTVFVSGVCAVSLRFGFTLTYLSEGFLHSLLCLLSVVPFFVSGSLWEFTSFPE